MIIDHLKKIIIFGFCFLIYVTSSSQASNSFVYNPKVYVVPYLEKNSFIKIDGDLSDIYWQKASWTTLFVDIEGETKPIPYHETKVKILWDDEYLYIGAEIQEDHLWATYDKQDMVIFQENNFEIFVDPDGDGQNYLELEINALDTHWDLVLTKPYRDEGVALSSFDIKGLKKGVKKYGTINKVTDRDQRWTLEIAIPLSILSEISGLKSLGKEDDAMKMNFSRVEWDRLIIDGKYVKMKDDNGKIKPANNWVWSPQASKTMHQPETWGIVVLSKKENQMTINEMIEDDKIKWQMRKIYYYQKEFYKKNQMFTSTVPTEFSLTNFEIEVVGSTYTAEYCKGRICYYIREDGKIWTSNKY